MTNKGNPSLLIIDDSKEHAKHFGDQAHGLFKQFGEKLDVALCHESGTLDERIEYLKGRDSVYVLLDVRLGPGWKIDGKPLKWSKWVDHIRGSLPNARIVLYSTHVGEEILQEALMPGVYAVVDKLQLEDPEGLLKVLAGFATMERRLREARAALAGKQDLGRRETDDILAELLLKISIGVLIIGNNGHVWFQNDYNVTHLAGGNKAEGEICRKAFHGWKCMSGPCPWCPTMEAMNLRKRRECALLLPTPLEGRFRLQCYDLVSEPLLPYIEQYRDHCAGAIETCRNCQAEWENKAVIQRILDLMVMALGLVADGGTPVRVNLYEISESKLLCRPLASGDVSKPSDGQLLLEEHVTLKVDPNVPDWDKECVAPGPGCKTSTRIHNDGWLAGRISLRSPSCFRTARHAAL